MGPGNEGMTFPGAVRLVVALSRWAGKDRDFGPAEEQKPQGLSQRRTESEKRSSQVKDIVLEGDMLQYQIFLGGGIDPEWLGSAEGFPHLKGSAEKALGNGDGENKDKGNPTDNFMSCESIAELNRLGQLIEGSLRVGSGSDQLNKFVRYMKWALRSEEGFVGEEALEGTKIDHVPGLTRWDKKLLLKALTETTCLNPGMNAGTSIAGTDSPGIVDYGADYLAMVQTANKVLTGTNQRLFYLIPHHIMIMLKLCKFEKCDDTDCPMTLHYADGNGVDYDGRMHEILTVPNKDSDSITEGDIDEAALREFKRHKRDVDKREQFALSHVTWNDRTHLSRAEKSAAGFCKTTTDIQCDLGHDDRSFCNQEMGPPPGPEQAKCVEFKLDDFIFMMPGLSEEDRKALKKTYYCECPAGSCQVVVPKGTEWVGATKRDYFTSEGPNRQVCAWQDDIRKSWSRARKNSGGIPTIENMLSELVQLEDRDCKHSSDISSGKETYYPYENMFINAGFKFADSGTQ